MRCFNCRKEFDYEKYYGICPKCGCFNQKESREERHEDLHDRFTAPALIRDVAAAIGGSGGGRPDQAQAGGSNVEGIDEAFRILKQKIAG